MKLDKKTAKAYSEVIRVEDYKLVAALGHFGFKVIHREYPWISEEIAEWALPHVRAESVYIYPHSEELIEALEALQKSDTWFSSNDWRYALDEIKVRFGIGPSKLKNFEVEEQPNGKYQITPHK